MTALAMKKKHKSQKSIAQATNLVTDKLNKKGYLDVKITKTKLNDSVFEHKYQLGKRINYARIYIGINFRICT